MGKIEKNEVYMVEPNFFNLAKIEVTESPLKRINHVEKTILL